MSSSIIDVSLGLVLLNKRRSQAWLIGFGLILAGLLNLDTFAIARTLSTDAAVSAAVVNAAQQDYLAHRMATSPPLATENADEIQKRWKALSDDVGALTGLGFSIAWNVEQLPKGTGHWVAKLLGIAITGLTTSVGAATWFSALGQLLALRSAVQPRRPDT